MFISLLWEELINREKFPIIVIDMNDNLGKRYNAKMIKYDKRKNVLIRYLNNPYYEKLYWWTGNEKNMSGLNPKSYFAKCLGDAEDDLDGLIETDFVEDGYDDIINFEKESQRFFKPIKEYPFLNGEQGNIHVDSYYISSYNMELSRNIIPSCIEKKIGEGGKRIKSKAGDIMELVIDIISPSFCPIIEEYKKYKEYKIAEMQLMISFKKYLGLLMSHKFIRENSEKIGIEVSKLYIIKSELEKGYKIPELIKILPYILKQSIITRTGEKTLSIYTFHFIIIFGSYVGIGLKQFFYKALNPYEAIIGALAFIIVVCAISLYYAKTNAFIYNLLQKIVNRIKTKYLKG